MRRCSGTILAIVLALASPVSAQEPGKIISAAQRVLEGRNYQRSVPYRGSDDSPDGRDGAWTERRTRPGRTQEPIDRRSQTLDAPKWVADVALVVLIILAWAAVVGIVSMLVKASWGGSRPELREPPAPKPTETLWAPEQLADFEEAARAGRFAEALHWLLLHALARAVAVSGQRFPKAATSREIASTVPLSASARGDLSAIVRTAELSAFGLRRGGSEEFERVLAHFHSLVQACPLKGA